MARPPIQPEDKVRRHPPPARRGEYAPGGGGKPPARTVLVKGRNGRLVRRRSRE